MTQMYRYRGSVPPAPHRAVYDVATVTEEAGEATLWLYDVIDSWGGDWGVSAAEVATALGALSPAVTTINLRINSPGGEVWDAVAMLNLLREHPARVVAHVDGLAASAASLLAAGSDEVVAGRNTQMMIHDAWGLAVGPAATMRKTADMLDRTSDDVAAVYAAKAGGDVADWRTAMQAETWYTAAEAVEAGLADRIAEDAAVSPENRFDLSVFAHLGRLDAPAPSIPSRPNALRVRRALLERRR